jgi:zinc and cadmium transporter
MDPITAALLSVLAVSVVSLVGVITLRVQTDTLKRLVPLLVSVSIGALLANAFLHLIPEASEELGTQAAYWILGGIVVFFILEKFLHWHHAHHTHATDTHECEDCEEPHHPVGALVITADALHNVLDGAIIAAGYMVSFEVGLATTLAVALHELPQEIGDFGVLVHAGFSRAKALLANFASALAAFVGVGLVVVLGETFTNATPVFAALAAGSFIYIAMADLLPELNKTTRIRASFLQLCFVLLGMGLIVLVTPDEHAHALDTENEHAQEYNHELLDTHLDEHDEIPMLHY